VTCDVIYWLWAYLWFVYGLFYEAVSKKTINFMVTPCINNIQHFNNQLMHTTLKNLELLKYFKIRKLLQHVSVYKETIIREPQSVRS